MHYIADPDLRPYQGKHFLSEKQSLIHFPAQLQKLKNAFFMTAKYFTFCCRNPCICSSSLVFTLRYISAFPLKKDQDSRKGKGRRCWLDA